MLCPGDSDSGQHSNLHRGNEDEELEEFGYHVYCSSRYCGYPQLVPHNTLQVG